MAAEKGRGMLTQVLLRNLGDRSYEKRKSAALEIENVIKSTNVREPGNPDMPPEAVQERIRGVLDVLVKQFAGSQQPNSRKGGLIGLAAAAIALMDDTPLYLAHILPPVLKCFIDSDARVRYYACESLYNVTKVARSHVLVYFNEIFDGLCRLYGDSDDDVKNGAQLLDRLLKDVVTESDSFSVERFIPLLRERIRIKEPMIRQLLIGWISVLDSVPEIDMLAFLPEYLGGIFDMLSDSKKDIRQQAYSALAEFLREIVQASGVVNLGPMMAILVEQARSADHFTRLTALSWMGEFVQIGQTKLLGFTADMLSACLHCISDSEEEIRGKAEAANGMLLELVRGTDEDFELGAVLEGLTRYIGNRWVPTRLASLRWISMLLTKMPKTLHEHLGELFPTLLRTLSDVDEQVVRVDLEVLARISLDKDNFEMVLNELMSLFQQHRKLLETRGSLIIRQLCVLLDGESIYRALARTLMKQDDIEFAGLMVQTLSLILLTSAELMDLRALLKRSLVTDEGRDLFITLFNAWCHNPVATFGLCLLAEAYELASALAFELADVDVTVGFLMQVDKLVQLIESPIFVHVRLHLLEPREHPFLLKSLYGLLMLLPQSSAFASLKARLESVAPLGALGDLPESKWAASKKTRQKVVESKRLNFDELLTKFKETQARHAEDRRATFRQHSLLQDAAAAE